MYYSNQVSYKKTDNTEVNVETALNELYEKTSSFGNTTLAGQININNRYSYGVTQTLNLSSINGYENFELYKNIFLVLLSPNVSSWDGNPSSIPKFSLTYEYNNTTGILSITGYSGGYTAFNGTFNIYVVS